MSLSNKALQMDPHASRLVGSITEYSASKGSSSFSDEHWPGMNIARLLLALEQGTRSLEDYIQEYLTIANYSNLPDCLLRVFFAKALINRWCLSLDVRVHVHHSVSLWTMLCCVLALHSVWVSRMRNATPHLWLKWWLHQSTLTKWQPQQHPVMSLLPFMNQAKSQLIFMNQAKSQLIFMNQAKSQLIFMNQAKSQLIFMNQAKSQLIFMNQAKSQLIFMS